MLIQFQFDASMDVSEMAVAADLSSLLNIEGVNHNRDVQNFKHQNISGKIFNQHISQELEMVHSFERVAMSLCQNSKIAMDNALSLAAQNEGPHKV